MLTFEIGYVVFRSLVSVEVVPGSTCIKTSRRLHEKALVLISRKVNGARWLLLSSLLRRLRMNMPWMIILCSVHLGWRLVFRFTDEKALLQPMRSFFQFCDSCCSSDLTNRACTHWLLPSLSPLNRLYHIFVHLDRNERSLQSSFYLPKERKTNHSTARISTAIFLFTI